MKTAVWGLLIPFMGTAAGAACVFFLKKDLKSGVQRALTGFAAGVMVAASIWSLIVPAIEQSASKGRWAFLPAFTGFWVGILFLLLLDHIIPHLHRSIDQADQTEGPVTKLNRTIMMVLAVKKDLKSGVQRALTGFAAGVMVAASIWSLIVPAIEQSASKGRWAFLPAFTGFWLGVLSGAVEPVFGGLTVLIASLVIPAMPYFLSFAAGAMLYVVVEELIPEMSEGRHSNIGVIFFAVGFSLMMALDVALG